MHPSEYTKRVITGGEIDLDRIEYLKSLEYRNRLLSRDEIEVEYGITRRWLELAALSGNGPMMVRISRRMVKYQRGAFEDWLTSRTVNSTSDEIEAA